MDGRSRRSRWLLGLTIGLVFGVASLTLGVIAWALALGALVLLALDRARTVLVGGALIGFGVAWNAILLMADWRCQEGCTGPNLTPWYVIGAVSIVAGLGLSVVGATSRKAM